MQSCILIVGVNPICLLIGKNFIKQRILYNIDLPVKWRVMTYFSEQGIKASKIDFRSNLIKYCK